MKKFKFRLEKVMDMRAEAERQRQMALAEARMKVEAEEQRLQSLHETVTSEKNAIELLRTGGAIKPREINAHYQYIRRLKLDIDHQRQNIFKAKQEQELRRQELLEAAKERKMLENLKDRQREAYMAEVNRKDQALIDDVAVTRFGKERT